jgi:regulator of CtrA degradation
MALIEEVAAYLDGPGRAESRSLSREASYVYATESMRLTTRLMQLASWLLLQRAVNEGEITAESAREEKQKVKFSATPSERGGPGWSELPDRLRDYVEQGDRLFERVVRFDRIERGEESAAPEVPAEETEVNGVAGQLSRLKAAFNSGG